MAKQSGTKEIAKNRADIKDGIYQKQYKDTYEKTMTAIKTKEEDPLSISIDCKYYNGKYYSLCDINK